MKFIIYVFLTILTLAQTGQAQTAKSMTVPEIAVYNKPDREKMLYEGAKKEGKLMWYTSLTGGPNVDAPKIFQAKYPGIQVEFIVATATR